MVVGFSLLLFSTPPPAIAQTPDLTEPVEQRYAENDGVRIHYVALGQGHLLVMVHGFPGFWYGWRHYRADYPRELYASPRAR